MKKASKGTKARFKYRPSRKQSRSSSKNQSVSTHFDGNDAPCLDLKELLERHGCQLKPKESTNTYSKLSPTLADILKNPLYFGYFIEYLDVKAVKHLADFWLAADAFHIVSSEKHQKPKIAQCLQLQVEGNCDSMNDNINSDSDSDYESLKDLTTVIPNDTCNHVFNGVEEDGKLLCENCRKLQLKYPVKHRRASISVYTGDKLSDKEQQVVHPHVDTSDGENCSSPDISESLLNVQLQCDWQPFSIYSDSASPKPDVKSHEDSPHRPLRRVMTRETRQQTKSIVVDAIGIYTKYISLDAEIAIGLSSDARQNVEAKISKDRNSINPDCFVEVQDFVQSKLEEYLQQFMDSSFGRKYQLNILNSSKLDLQDILYNEISLLNFTEFLETQQSQAVLQFWFMAEGFEKNILEALLAESYIADVALEDAMTIYEKYFSMRASNRLIKDDKLRIVTENNICREDGPQANCFCIPMAYAWTVLKEIFFPRFLVSDIYYQFLENLNKNSKTDYSINDEASSITSSNSREEPEELILLSEDFLDKDLDDMWYRPDAGRLALGYVDELGIFIPEMEPEPDNETDHSSVSKLGKRMRNLLVRESVADRERIAWEKARKIIQDVQKHNK